MSAPTIDRTDLNNRVLTWFADFADALATPDAEAAASATADLFVEQGYWRDLTTFTWNLHTAEGRESIEDLVKGTHGTGNLTISNIEIDRDAVVEDAADGDGEDIFAFVTF